MQKNLNFKKRSYVSLALLLSCVASSAYSMDNVDAGSESDEEILLNDNRRTEAARVNNAYSVSDNAVNTPVQTQNNGIFARLRNLVNLNNLTRSQQANVQDQLNSQELNRLSPAELEAQEQRLFADLNRRHQERVSQQQMANQEAAMLDNGNSARVIVEPDQAPDALASYDDGAGVGLDVGQAQQVSFVAQEGPALANYDDGVGVRLNDEQIQIQEDNILESVAAPLFVEMPVEYAEPAVVPVVAGEQPVARLNAAQKILNKINKNKRLAAGAAGAVVVTGTGVYLLRKPIYNLYNKAKLNAKAALLKLQNKKVTKGAVLKGMLGLAGTTATAYAAHQAYQNPVAARNLLSNRKVQMGALGTVATLGGVKLLHNYLSRNSAKQPDAQSVDAQRFTTLNDVIDDFETTLTQEQWICPGIDDALEALGKGEVLLFTRILADNAIVLTDLQQQQVRVIIDKLAR